MDLTLNECTPLARLNRRGISMFEDDLGCSVENTLWEAKEEAENSVRGILEM